MPFSSALSCLDPIRIQIPIDTDRTLGIASVMTVRPLGRTSFITSGMAYLIRCAQTVPWMTDFELKGAISLLSHPFPKGHMERQGQPGVLPFAAHSCRFREPAASFFVFRLGWHFGAKPNSSCEELPPSLKLVRTMRNRIYFAGFLVAAGLLLYFGRNLIGRSALVAWSLAFAGTTAVAVLGMALYRVQHELRASRHELARKEAELNFALEVQRALFPKKFPADGGLEFSGVCVPASGISGDYFDVIQVSGGRIAFVLADISGKGISAAILMSNSHAVLRMLAHAGHPPREVCGQLNHH